MLHTYFLSNQSEESFQVNLAPEPSKIAKKDRIDLAMRQEFDMTRDPVMNIIPKARLQKAKTIRQGKLSKQNKSQSRIAGVSWTERGPNNVGGRTRTLLWDPNDAFNTKVWAGSVGGGLWYNNDITSASSQWQSVNDNWNNIAISAMAHDPNNTNVMYVGTGEGHIIGSARGEGMYKSTDGGATWAHMTAANGFYATDANFHYVNDIIVKNESGSSVLYVGTQESLNGYTYFGYSASGDRGLWRSTDGGVTFTQVLPNVSGQSYPYAVADLELSASGRIYVGTTRDYNGAVGAYYAGGGNILYSDNGTTWTNAYNPGTGERVEIALAPSDSETAYAISAVGSNVGWMVKSTNANQTTPTWSSLSIPAYTAQSCGASANDFTRGQAWYDLIMQVHPTNANTMIIGGIDLYRTTNGGTSFNLISYWTGGCDTYVHADQHQIAFNPADPNEVIFGNDGGVYYSSDITASNPVIGARNSGYNVTQFYGAAIHPTAGTDHFLAGAQDNGSQKFTDSGMNATTEVSGGDGAYCNIDQDQPTYQWTQYVFNSYYRSTNGGASFTNIPEFGSSVGRFINPSRYDDTQNIMYAAAGTNQLMRWANAQTGSTGTFVTVNTLGGGQISALTVSPNTANRLFVATGASTSGATPGGKVYRIDNAHTGATLTAVDISSASFPANGYISCIEVENGNDNHMLVTFSNYGVNSIWETNNGGTSWIQVEGDLPDMPVRWALFHPLDNTAAIIATELGVWTTNALNGASTSWGPAASGMPNVRTDMLQLRASDNEVIAATHGRGLFSSSSFAAPPTTDPEISFVSTSGSSYEVSESAAGSGDCRPYKDHVINMQIANPPTGNATVTISLGASTSATEWDDFVFTTNGNFTAGSKSNNLQFSNGLVANQSFTLRVYDDATIENTENIVFEYSISGATDALKSAARTTHTFTINDNDVNPTFAGDAVLISEDFEGGVLPGGWSIAEATTSVNDWRVDTENAISGTHSAYVSRSATSTQYNGNDDAATFLITPQINATGLSNMTFSFDYICNGEIWAGTRYDYGVLAYSFDGSSFVPLNTDRFQGVTTKTSYTTTLPSNLDGQTFYLAFYWTNDVTVGNSPALIVDDVSLIAEATTTIASTINQGTEQYLGPNETVLFYDDLSGELLAKIENTSSHDYGCTSIDIDRAGATTSEFWSSNTSEYLMDKTVYVNPSNNNINGTYNITLYYSQAEVNNWMLSTGKPWSNLKLAKVSTAISDVNSVSAGEFNPELGSANNPATFGDGYAITSSFTTGFSGFGAGDPGSPPPALPLQLLSFTADNQGEDVILDWSSATEINTDYIEIEHSWDGEEFEKIGEVKAAGNSEKKIDYQFLHKDVAYGMHYYRLKTVDLDASFEYSWVESVFNKSSNFDIINIYPIPVKENANLHFSCDNAGNTCVLLINTWGVVVASKDYETQIGTNQVSIDCSNFTTGVYFVVVENEGRRLKQRILIK
ncbi:T9SS type A sorting domain-containing protein [Fulvivirga aurantia]|uniref:T9SS type A sorting domain-containing protein n=1 Tax=Fulvivirga aurantia TaxID=2529383 RepID=UPI001CA43575